MPRTTTSSIASTCGFKHALPLPDPATLEREYRDNYYADEKPNFIAHAGEDQPWFELAQTDRLETFEKLTACRRTAAACWISAAAPDFFWRPRCKRGWQGFGIEPSRQAAAHARALGAQITEGLFNAETRRGAGPLRCR